ncbi:hypothetical protein [Leeia oryzae]|uniref:hypothetical protein n=1 Tax=Leeia oryzae TaxID=356662 RepID=UPI0003617FD9|nr:hypothetical protein [Leeia oryzae]
MNPTLNTPPVLPSKRRKLDGRHMLLIMLGICLLPWLAAELAFRFFPPQGGQSYGELLAEPLLKPDPQWRLLAHDPAGCSQALAGFALVARQVSLAQGREMDRIRPEQTGGCEKPLVASKDYTALQSRGAGLYLIDTHGNAVVRYSASQLADDEGRKQVIKEVGLLLKNNPALG